LQIETGKAKAAAETPAVAAPHAPHRQRQYRERLAAMREDVRERRQYRRAAAAPIFGFEPLQINFGIPQYQAMQPQNAYGDNAAALPLNSLPPADGFGMRYADLGRPQNQFMGNNVAPQQWRQAGGDIFHGVWQQGTAAVDSRLAGPPIENQTDQHDLLATGDRIHSFRADMARRRDAQHQRRNKVQNNTNPPLQFPNPAFLNNKNLAQPPPNLVQQVQPQATGYQAAQQRPQNSGGWLPEIPQQDVLFDPFIFDESPDRGGMWRDRFRPPTPLSPNNDVAGHNPLIQRQIVPGQPFDLGRDLQHNRPVVPIVPPQQQPSYEQI